MNQALVVTADGWDAVQAQLNGIERMADGGWRVVFRGIPVVLGLNGMGWGRGLFGEGWAEPGEPMKREGDRRSPAGVFALHGVFGNAPEAPEGVRLPYLACTPQLRWVDDPESLFYNRPVEVAPGEDEGWRSAEVMARADGLYRLGVIVGHNMNPVERGAGSCIFLHVWAGPAIGTAGCTAMALEPLERLVAWLDPAACPVLIQVPREVLHRSEFFKDIRRSCEIS